MSQPTLPTTRAQAQRAVAASSDGATEVIRLREEMLRLREEMLSLQGNRQPLRIRKGDPPSFSGKDREDVEKFIFLTEEFYFEYDDIRTADTEQFARIVMSNLKADASTWFQNFTEVSRSEGVKRTWDVMKKQLRLQFGKADNKMKAIENVLRAKQKGSVQEFSNYLTTNILKSGEQWPEQIQIGILRVSLDKKLADEICRRTPKTMAEAIKIAKAEEARCRKEGKIKDKTETPTDNKRAPKEKTIICFSCGNKGHKSPDCKASDEDKAAHKLKREGDKRAKEALESK